MENKKMHNKIQRKLLVFLIILKLISFLYKIIKIYRINLKELLTVEFVKKLINKKSFKNCKFIIF
jgi:hypothetical protein